VPKQRVPLSQLLIGLNPDKCRQRNYLSARDGVVTTTMRLARSVDRSVEYARGSISLADEARLDRINALLSPHAPRLTLEKVLLLPPMEAANSNLATDRGLFIGTSTMKNIAADANLGFAFMNSHRTGHISAESELPLGKTYQGKYERFAAEDPESLERKYERVTINTYMVAGTYPNGQSGPSADDIYAMVMGGVIEDVSVGMYGGVPLCDVCGKDVSNEAERPHIPMTSAGMERDDISRQRARGVPGGVATYTYEDGTANEVSSVYDGAIPGAGFSKALLYAKSGRLSPSVLDEVLTAYRDILLEGDKRAMDSQANKGGFLERIFGPRSEDASGKGAIRMSDGVTEIVVSEDELSQAWGQPATKDFHTDVEAPVQAARADSAEVLRLNEQLSAERARLSKILLEKATREADDLIEHGHILPASRPALVALSNILIQEGTPIPQEVEYLDATGKKVICSPSRLLSNVLENVPQHDLLKEHDLSSLPEGAILVRANVDEDDEAQREAREDARKAVEAGSAAGPKKGTRQSKASTNGRHA
jgi:hypothetical protein